MAMVDIRSEDPPDPAPKSVIQMRKYWPKRRLIGLDVRMGIERANHHR